MNAPTPRLSTTELRELNQLVCELFDPSLQDSAARRIEALVTSRANGIEEYTRAMETAIGLRWRFVGGDVPAAIQPATTITLPRKFPRVLTTKLLALAASVLLVGYFMGLTGLVLWDLGNPMLTHPSPMDRENVAQVISMNDCRWQSGFAPHVGAVVQTATLEHGVAELKLKDGATVVIEGPTTLAIEGPNQARLAHGRLIASVPQSAVGFMVMTPSAIVTDLGTEFGLAVDETGSTDVQVMRGEVKVDLATASGTGRSAESALRMNAGSAKRFDIHAANQITSLKQVSPWITKATGSERHAANRASLAAETKYAAAVLADRPLGYWRFSDGGKSVAKDESGNEHHGQYHGFVSTIDPGIMPGTRDQSVRFMGEKILGWIELGKITLPPSFTIEMWIRSTTPEWNTFGWPLSTGYEPNGILIHPQQGTRRLNFFVMDDREGILNAAEFTPTVIDDRLHQYVFAYSAERNQGRMYVDGQLANERSDVFPSTYRRKTAELIFDVGRQRGMERAGEGWIDELAIYPSVLSAESVRRHYAAAADSVTQSHEPLRTTKE